MRQSVVIDVRKGSSCHGKLGQVQIVRAPRLRGSPRAHAFSSQKAEFARPGDIIWRRLTLSSEHQYPLAIKFKAPHLMAQDASRAGIGLDSTEMFARSYCECSTPQVTRPVSPVVVVMNSRGQVVQAQTPNCSPHSATDFAVCRAVKVCSSGLILGTLFVVFFSSQALGLTKVRNLWCRSQRRKLLMR